MLVLHHFSRVSEIQHQQVLYSSLICLQDAWQYIMERGYAVSVSHTSHDDSPGGSVTFTFHDLPREVVEVSCLGLFA